MTCAGMAQARPSTWGPDSRTLAVYLSGASQQDADLYLMINASDSDRTFEIQEGRPGEWQLVFDTGRPSPDDFPEPADRTCLADFILCRWLAIHRWVDFRRVHNRTRGLNPFDLLSPLDA